MLRVLDNLTVRKKLLLLVITPVIFCVIIFVNYVAKIEQDRGQIHSIVDRYSLYDTFNDDILLADKIRRAPIDEKGNAYTADALLAYAEQQLKFYRSMRLEDFSLPSTPANQQRFDSIEVALADLIDVVREGYDHEMWVEYANEYTNAILIFQGTQPVNTVNARLRKGVLAYSRLVQLGEMSNRELALMEHMTADAENIASSFRDIDIKQSVLLNQYLDYLATDEQVELLLTAFSQEAFQKANQIRAELMLGRVPNNLNSSLSIIATREAILLDVLNDVRGSIIAQAEHIYSELTYSFYLVIILLVMMIIILICLGIAITKRTLASIDSIGTTLSGVESTRNYDLRVNIKGNDEFALLAGQLNELIEERQKFEAHLVEAKEQAEAANHAKSTFLANMSHEMRTPLNGIIGMGNILADTQMNSLQHDYLKTIRSSSKALLGIINDVLDISKIESGSLNISFIESSMSDLVDDVCTIIQPKARERGINFELDYDISIPAILKMDDVRIRQVLLNLLSNAVKFTESGFVRLKCSVLAINDNQADILLSVQDSGIGIAQDKLASVFEPFKQEDSSITRRFAGTGLGLAITKELIDMMGGELSAESVQGEGSLFSCRMKLDVISESVLEWDRFDNDIDVVISSKVTSPELINLPNELQYYPLDSFIQNEHAKSLALFIIGDNSEAELVANYIERHQKRSVILLLPNVVPDLSLFQGALIEGYITLPATPNRIHKVISRTINGFSRSVLNTEQESQVFEPKHILLIEDNTINQMVAQTLLEDKGYTVSIANDGLEGLKAFEEGEFDCVLMDCMMPVMDGLTSTQKIREFEANNKKVKTPIIALTASTLNDDIQACYDSGMDYYVPKPFEPDILFNAIEKMLSE